MLTRQHGHVKRIYQICSNTKKTARAPVPIVGGRRAMSTVLNAAGGGTDGLVTAANSLGGASKPILPNAEEKYIPKLVNFVHPTTTAPLRMQLSVNGVNMPSTQVSAYEAYALTRQNLQGSQFIVRKTCKWRIIATTTLCSVSRVLTLAMVNMNGFCRVSIRMDPAPTSPSQRMVLASPRICSSSWNVRVPSGWAKEKV